MPSYAQFLSEKAAALLVSCQGRTISTAVKTLPLLDSEWIHLENAFSLGRVLLGHAPLDLHLPQRETLLWRWNERGLTLKWEFGNLNQKFLIVVIELHECACLVTTRRVCQSLMGSRWWPTYIDAVLRLYLLLFCVCVCLYFDTNISNYGSRTAVNASR